MEGVATVCSAGEAGGVELVLLPPPQPIPETIRQSERAVAAMVAVRGNRTVPRRDGVERMKATNAASRAAMSQGAGRNGKDEMGAPGTTDAPNVLMETVKGTELPEVTVRLVGGTHVAPKGTPEQVKLSVPLKPLPGVAWRLN